MKSFMKRGAALTAVLTTAAVMAGCGGSGSAPKAAEGQKFAGQTIRFVASNHTYTDAIKPLIPEFEKKTGIKVKMARESGAKIIVITSHMKSPLSKLADVSLYGTAKETEYRSEAMASRLVHLAIVDVLYVGVVLREQDRIGDNMEKIRQAIAVRRV